MVVGMTTTAIDLDALGRIGHALADYTSRRLLVELLAGPAYPSALVPTLDTTTANVQAKLAALDVLLQGARRAQNGRGARVYLHFQAGADSAAWRSEILDYRLELGEDAAVGLYQARLGCTLIVLRRL